MILQTARLRLRPFHAKDCSAVVFALNDWAVAQWVSTPPFPYGADDFAAYREIVARDHGGPHPLRFAVARHESDDLVGCVTVEPRAEGEGELGYWYCRDAWGCGYGTEAAAALIEHALDHPAIRRLIAVTDPDNEPSQRVLLKSGFMLAGTREWTRHSRRGNMFAHLHEYRR